LTAPRGRFQPNDQPTDAQSGWGWQMNGISKAVFAQKGGFSRRKGPNSNLDAIALKRLRILEILDII
jgi:hypothetical protein